MEGAESAEEFHAVEVEGEVSAANWQVVVVDGRNAQALCALMGEQHREDPAAQIAPLSA